MYSFDCDPISAFYDYPKIKQSIPRASHLTQREHFAAKARETFPLNLVDVALTS